MSAADAREQLEAAIWRAVQCSHSKKNAHVIAALSFADNYAEQVADERIAGHVASRDAAVRRHRLEACAAEYYGATR